MVKIKLARSGKKNSPSYRIVVQEARSKRDGKVVEVLGYYRPLDVPPALHIDKPRYQKWIAVGARPTETVFHLSKKA